VQASRRPPRCSQPSEELRCWQQQPPSEALLSGAPGRAAAEREAVHVASPAERGAAAAERRAAEQAAAGVERGAAVRGAALYSRQRGDAGSGRGRAR